MAGRPPGGAHDPFVANGMARFLPGLMTKPVVAVSWCLRAT